ncbi:psbP domain-containing protein 6, chloroplastic isoform X2 [Manihot esculenta]|uniref:psbP domain-containing protein 6, chloroplastic isoform X2 n=1 Tax=Manihot esculenta TaxID=3983 RepID=UPI000B5D67FD|nr:psbP domain-containing protein 6, chloroplastic isoform X2 [Manihot esculenta]
MATASLSPISPVFSISTSQKSPITTSTPTPPTVWHQTRSYSSLRRQILHGLALSPLILIKETAISEAKEVEFLAGNVQPYQFILPPTWKQTRVANILSGNYCQPKCAEPWVEVKFEDEKQGKVQVVASPLIRLTNKPNASIEEIGSPEKLIASLGPFVTGNSYDPDELLETSIEKLGDQTYYKYVLETPYALTGTHNLAKATAKGSTVVLFVASANDKQWQTSEKTLKAILDSFQL